MHKMTYPLSPVDYALLVKHESLQRRGYCGLSVMIAAELDGALGSNELRAAVGKLGEQYPALSAHIRYAGKLRRPAWRIESTGAGQPAIEYAHHPRDDNADGVTALDSAIDDPVNVHEGTQLRLVHIELPGARHVVALRWAHPLMDMEGGHLLLGALDAILKGQEPSLDNDPRVVFPPAYQASTLSAWRSAWRGCWIYKKYDAVHQPRLIQKPENAPKRCRILVRHYTSEQRAQFEAKAKTRLAPGPLLYSRAMIVALGRAYRAMAEEKGRPRPRYLFPMPLPLPRQGPRPGVHGNHVTIAWILFDSDDLSDWSRADRVASDQFRRHFDEGHAEAEWFMMRAASRWPFGFMNYLTSHRRHRAAAGFTGYQFDDSVTTLGNARIVRLFGAGPMDCHPGWMLGRTTYNGMMSLSVTYFEDYLDTAGVNEFLDRLERELFDS